MATKAKPKKLTTAKSAAHIHREMKRLRKFIEADGMGDPVAKRIAYSIETALRWALEDTVGWPGLVEEAKDNAACLEVDLHSNR